VRKGTGRGGGGRRNVVLDVAEGVGRRKAQKARTLNISGIPNLRPTEGACNAMGPFTRKRRLFDGPSPPISITCVLKF